MDCSQSSSEQPSSPANARRQLYPMRVKLRISAFFLALCQIVNLVGCSLLLTWQLSSSSSSSSPSPSSSSRSCVDRSKFAFASQIALSVVRLALMATNALLTYNAGRAAVEEAVLCDQRKMSKSVVVDDDASPLVGARSRTQTQYDRVLLLNAFFEPAFSLLQLAFYIVQVVVVARRWDECISRTYRLPYLAVSIVVLASEWLFVLLRLAYGSGVISWRGLFGFELGAWEKHHQERIEHVLRFILCCFLGKPGYLTVADAVLGRVPHPVAMGVAKMFDFRAFGTASMLEFFRAMDHIRRIDTRKMEERRAMKLNDLVEAHPLSARHRRLILEACTFVRFSSAAYTTAAHDMLRIKKYMNPFIHWRRQELGRSCCGGDKKRRRREEEEEESVVEMEESPSARNYILDKVKGDNFWCGHTKAFARYARVSFKDVLGGRVAPDEPIRPEGMSAVTGLTSYFVVRSPKQKALIVAIRGTANMEDILTDVHAFEGRVFHEDVGLEGKGKGTGNGKQGLGYAHYGVLESTREIYGELMGKDGEGLLPTLMSSPAYAGYSLRLVGQSLGSAVASLLTLRLRKQFPHIHCFAYNPWPVVDENVVESVGVNVCKSLVTQICCNEDVVNRLTFPAVMKLHERICEEIIQVQQDPWRGDSCKLCCPDVRALSASCQFCCNHICYCCEHINDHMDETIDGRGISRKAPNYIISTPEQLEEHHRAAAMLDTPPSMPPRTVKRAWTPVAMKMSNETKNVMPHVYKSGKLRQSLYLSALDSEMKFPINSLNQREFSSRWGTLKEARWGTLKEARSRLNFSKEILGNSIDSQPDSETHVSLRFSGISYVLFGEILNLRSCLDSKGEHAWFAMGDKPESFFEISMSSSMFVDHMPWHLEAGLNQVCERMLSKT